MLCSAVNSKLINDIERRIHQVTEDKGSTTSTRKKKDENKKIEMPFGNHTSSPITTKRKETLLTSSTPYPSIHPPIFISCRYSKNKTKPSISFPPLIIYKTKLFHHHHHSPIFFFYSTVTDLAKLRGKSTLTPSATASQ